MLKFVGIRVHCAYKIGILNHGEEETLGTGPKMTFSIHTNFDSADDVKVLNFTNVML